MRPFAYNANPGRVVFGFGTLTEVPNEVRKLGCRRAVVLSTAGQRQSADEVVRLLGDLCVGLYRYTRGRFRPSSIPG
jgi:maleylacetate reductase